MDFADAFEGAMGEAEARALHNLLMSGEESEMELLAARRHSAASLALAWTGASRLSCTPSRSWSHAAGWPAAGRSRSADG